ncbi:MAG: AAA family ATPase, partial [archaeon]|nr:AAA family ATPase [archaeon]
MTYIKRVVMHGFKSFGDRTVSVQLAPGFTCIVGPNGAGKSNVIDALCFCLGRVSKKTMRAKNLKDLIFAGTKTLKAAGTATVSLFFDNSQGEFPMDADELEITRTVKSKGGSKFKINGKASTREQVLNLLAQGNIDPDGSNQFVLQGKIVELTHMNIVERRKFIETLIGLEKYDQMKDATLRELEKADKDLGKFEAIFKEVSTQLKKYEKEKNDALRWKELDEKVKQYSAELIAIKIEKLREEEGGLEKKIDEISVLIQDLEQKQSRQKEKIEQENLVMSNLEDTLNEKNAERSDIEQELSELKSELSAKETELKMAKDSIEKLEERKEKLQAMQEALEEGASYDSLIEETGAEIEKANENMEENNQAVDETDAAINEKDTAISQLEAEKGELKSEISQNKQEISASESEIKMLNKNIKKFKKNLKTNEADLKKLKSEEESIEDALTRAQGEIEEINLRITELKDEIKE